jgi:hypothetical protein
MGLDLRFPLGLLFAVLGLLLTGFGLASDRSLYTASFDINVNFWWGLAMLVFGAGMLGAAYRGQGR